MSSDGRIKSVTRTLLNSRGQKRTYRGKERAIETTPQGYKFVMLNKDGTQSMMLVHRAVALAFIRKEDESLVVNHKDGDKSNNTVENLEWVTQGENVRHSRRIGLSAQRVLSENEVRAIRESSNTQEELATEYGIDQGAISKIKNRHTYKDII